MTMVNEQEECKTNVRHRSDDSKSNEELEPVGSIPTTDLSDSDDDVNEVNDDDSSLGMYKEVSGCGGNQKKTLCLSFFPIFFNTYNAKSNFILEEDLSFDNYEQEDTSNDHFITLDNFDAGEFFPLN